MQGKGRDVPHLPNCKKMGLIVILFQPLQFITVVPVLKYLTESTTYRISSEEPVKYTIR